MTRKKATPNTLRAPIPITRAPKELVAKVKFGSAAMQIFSPVDDVLDLARKQRRKMAAPDAANAAKAFARVLVRCFIDDDASDITWLLKQNEDRKRRKWLECCDRFTRVPTKKELAVQKWIDEVQPLRESTLEVDYPIALLSFLPFVAPESEKLTKADIETAYRAFMKSTSKYRLVAFAARLSVKCGAFTGNYEQQRKAFHQSMQRGM